MVHTSHPNVDPLLTSHLVCSLLMFSTRTWRSSSSRMVSRFSPASRKRGNKPLSVASKNFCKKLLRYLRNCKICLSSGRVKILNFMVMTMEYSRRTCFNSMDGDALAPHITRSSVAMAYVEQMGPSLP